jgi:hypothetical protein
VEVKTLKKERKAAYLVERRNRKSMSVLCVRDREIEKKRKGVRESGGEDRIRNDAKE